MSCKTTALTACLFLIWVILPAAGAASAPDALEQRLAAEQAGATARLTAEAQRRGAPEQVAQFIKDLDSADEQVRSAAVTQLRLLSRRVDVSGGQRVQRGERFDPQVPGLLPHLIKASNDSSESIRMLAMFALADTLEPEAVDVLRSKLGKGRLGAPPPAKDDPAGAKFITPTDRDRLIAACLLTGFADASGLEELKKAVRRLTTETDEASLFPKKYFDGELVLASLARITGKSFGPIPMNPMLFSDSKKGAEAVREYKRQFAVWTAWWDWEPIGEAAPKKTTGWPLRPDTSPLPNETEIKRLREVLTRNDSLADRAAAACSLTRVQDTSLLEVLKETVRFLQKQPGGPTQLPRDFTAYQSVPRLNLGLNVLASMERIMGKGFGQVPEDPIIMGDPQKMEEAGKQYRALLDTWVAWWDWTPGK